MKPIRTRTKPLRRTRGDLIAVAVILCTCLTLGFIIWLTSPARHTHSQPADVPSQIANSPANFILPEAFSNSWSIASPATQFPVAFNNVVITAEGGTVVGREVTTGKVRWSYQRSRRLCGVAKGWDSSGLSLLVAVYRSGRGCQEIITLIPETGRRGPARTGSADNEVTISSNLNYLLLQGKTLLQTVDSNLFNATYYGNEIAVTSPQEQPRHGCTLSSAILGTARIAVIERCPGDEGYRLTVLPMRQADNDKTVDLSSKIITSNFVAPAPKLIGTVDGYTSIFYTGYQKSTGTSGPKIYQVTDAGKITNPITITTRNNQSSSELPNDSTPQHSGEIISFYTGTGTLVFDASTLTLRYFVPKALGPALALGGTLLLPSPSGITVRNSFNGSEIKLIPLKRKHFQNETIYLTATGKTIVEKIGSALTGLIP